MQAGWEIRHLPLLTILHHADKSAADPRLEAQNAVARRMYAEKHLSAWHRRLYVAALALGYGIRAVAPGGARGAWKAAFRAVVQLVPPPFGPPPGQAVTRRGR